MKKLLISFWGLALLVLLISCGREGLTAPQSTAAALPATSAEAGS